MIQAAKPEAETSTKHCGTFDYENQIKPFARGVFCSFPCRILVRLAENTNLSVKKQGNGIFWRQRLPMEPLQSPWGTSGQSCRGGMCREDEPQFSSSLYSLHTVLIHIFNCKNARRLTPQQHWVDIFFVSLDILCTRRGRYSEDESTCNALVCSRTCRRKKREDYSCSKGTRYSGTDVLRLEVGVFGNGRANGRENASDRPINIFLPTQARKSEQRRCPNARWTEALDPSRWLVMVQTTA